MPISEVFNEDCKKGMKRFPDGFFDLAVVDPPYFPGPERRGYYGQSISTRGVKRRNYPISDKWILPDQEYFDELFRVSKNQIIWGINYFIGKNEIPFSSGRIIWDKMNDSTDFSDCEIAYCSMIDSVRIFRFLWNGMIQGTPGNGTVMQGNKKLNQKRIHPTEKPFDLYKWIYRKFSDPGMKILDTHLGSGSHRTVAYDAGIDFWGFEIDKVHFDNGNKRFEILKQQLKLAI